MWPPPASAVGRRLSRGKPAAKPQPLRHRDRGPHFAASCCACATLTAPHAGGSRAGAAPPSRAVTSLSSRINTAWGCGARTRTVGPSPRRQLLRLRHPHSTSHRGLEGRGSTPKPGRHVNLVKNQQRMGLWRAHAHRGPLTSPPAAAAAPPWRRPARRARGRGAAPTPQARAAGRRPQRRGGRRRPRRPGGATARAAAWGRPVGGVPMGGQWEVNGEGSRRGKKRPLTQWRPQRRGGGSRRQRRPGAAMARAAAWGRPGGKCVQQMLKLGTAGITRTNAVCRQEADRAAGTGEAA